MTTTMMLGNGGALAVTGQPTAVYRVPRWKLVGGLSVGLALVAAGVAVLLSQVLSASGDSGGGLLALAMVAGAGVIVSVMSVRSASRVIELHAEGMVYRRGAVARWIAWESVVNIQESITRLHVYGIPATRMHTIKLRTADGRRVQLDHALHGIATLAREVNRAVTERQLPRIQPVLAAGLEVAFGKVAVSAGGIRHGKRLYQWHTIANIGVSAGVIWLRTRDNRTHRLARYEHLRNPYLFFTVVERGLWEAGV